MSEDESLHEFVVDDDNGGYLPPTRPAESRGEPGKMQPAKVLHPCFQSGSTRLRDSRRYLGKVVSMRFDHSAKKKKRF